MMRGVKLTISGRVQGVFFRDHTDKKAKSLGLKGYVKNLKDGGVEVIAEGQYEDVEKLIEWCGEGPDMADVDDLKIEEQEPTDEFESFNVEY